MSTYLTNHKMILFPTYVDQTYPKIKRNNEVGDIFYQNMIAQTKWLYTFACRPQMNHFGIALSEIKMINISTCSIILQYNCTSMWEVLNN